MSSYKILSWPNMIMHTVGSTDIQSTTCSARGKQYCWQDGSSRQKIDLLCKTSKSSYILLFDYGLWALPSNPVSHWVKNRLFLVSSQAFWVAYDGESHQGSALMILIHQWPLSHLSHIFSLLSDLQMGCSHEFEHGLSRAEGIPHWCDMIAHALHCHLMSASHSLSLFLLHWSHSMLAEHAGTLFSPHPPSLILSFHLFSFTVC